MTLLHNYEKIHPTFSHFNDSKDISSALDTSSVKSVRKRIMCQSSIRRRPPRYTYP